jgi:mRNA interferase MazF
MTDIPVRGEVWLVNLVLSQGHDQTGTRPALVVSHDTFNQDPLGLVIVVPVTRRDKHVRSHVEPPEGRRRHSKLRISRGSAPRRASGVSI